MKVVLTTIREFPEEDYWPFINALKMALPWLDGNVLFKEKIQAYTAKEYIGSSITDAHTTIEIVKESS